jgi:hypothetical protein
VRRRCGQPGFHGIFRAMLIRLSWLFYGRE